MKRLFLVFLACIISVSVCFTGCNTSPKNDKPATPDDDSAPRLVMASTDISLTIGETYTWKYAVKNFTETVKFSSNDEAVATISDNGIITAVGVGSTIVSATLGTIRKNCTVKVGSSATYNLRCKESSVELIPDRTFDLSENTSLYKAKEKVECAVAYESSDATVAEVSQDGIVTAKALGECDIRLSCVYEGKTYYATVKIVVNKAVWIDVPSEITVDYPAENATVIEYAIRDLQNNAINEVATFTVADESLFSVSGNTVKPLSCGDTTLTISYSGISTEVILHSVLTTAKTEYNLFAHSAAIENAEAWEFYHKGDKNFLCEPLSLTEETVAGEKPDTYFLKWSSRYVNSGKSCKYMGLYLPCRLTKEQVIALKEEGYKWIYVQLYVNPPKGIYISFEWAGAATSFSPDATSWRELYLDIDKFIENYDAICSNELRFVHTSIEDNENVYNVYIKPISFVK